MKHLVLAAFSVAVITAGLSGAGSRQAPAVKNGSLRGFVIDSQSGEPLADAQIRLTGGPIDPGTLTTLKTALASRDVLIPSTTTLSLEDFIEMVNDMAAARGMALNHPQLQNAISGFRSANESRFRTVSDLEGSFTIKNLPPGSYTVLTQREGYFGGTVNSGTTAPAKINVVVGPDETTEVTFRMSPGATISGRVTYNGQPQSSLGVQAFAIVYQNGYRVLQPVVSRATDDRGQYRLYHLPPGEYLIAATPRTTVRPALANNTQGDSGGTTAPPPGEERPVRTFFPGTVDRGAAAVIVLRGTEIADVDIPLRSSAFYRVSGEVRVTVPLSAMTTNSRQGDTVRADVAFALHDPNVPDDMGGVTIGTFPLQAAGGGVYVGKFQATGILPGSYDWRSAIYETSADGSLQPSTTVIPIEVRDADVEGLQIEINQTVKLDGVVTIDGAPPGPNKVRVFLQVDGASAKRPGYQALAARVVLADEKTGAF
jgi:hypothetical protein